MVDFPESFNPNEVPEDDRSFEPLPAGDYLMQVIDSDIKDTKTGGQQLVLTLEVLEGPYSNRRVWDRLNIRNQNADAQRIAQRGLADLCLAVGVNPLRNTEELHFKPFTGRLTIKADKTGNYGPSNSVRYKARGGQPPASKAAVERPTATAGQVAQRPPAQGNKPWQRPAA
jgi:hypothetical protein